MGQLDGKTGVVVGASRGLGRGVAERFSAAGATVVAVARTRGGLEELAAAHPRIRAEVADATDPTVVGELLGRHQPDVLALVAGASPLAAYANEESHRAGLGITVSAVLPRLTPQTELGRAAAAAYAARAGASQDQFAARLGPQVTPWIAGDAFVTIATADGGGGAYELTGEGLTKLTDVGR